MAGPGGGGAGGGGGFRSGGGGFGGGSGRGFGGGGFGGGPRPPHHHHHYGWGWGWGWRRPYGYYGGGGCLGGFIGLLLAPILFVIMSVALLIVSITGMVSDISSGGSYKYSEDALQTYARQQYNAIYGDNDAAYEDNIMILFVAEPEEGNMYAAIGWVGDNISTRVNDMFGGERTELGRAFQNRIPENYKNSLSRDLASVVETMENAVGDGTGGKHYIDAPLGSPNFPKLVNHSSLNVSQTTVGKALSSFYETTEISLSVVVADMGDIFEKGLQTGTIVMLIFGVIFLVLAIVLIVRAVKNKKNGGNGGAGGGNYGGGSGANYNGQGDPRYNPYNNMRF